MIFGHLVHVKTTLAEKVQAFLDGLLQCRFVLRSLCRNTDERVLILLQAVEQVKTLLFPLLKDSHKGHTILRGITLDSHLDVKNAFPGFEDLSF